MKHNTTRATVVIGATMALVMAGTAAVSAAPADRDDRGPKRGQAGIGAQKGGQAMPGARNKGARGGKRGPVGMRGLDADFERRETILQTADGVSVKRVEQGAVDSVAADALTFSLGSGETVTVVIDDDTQVVGFEEQEHTVRGWSRVRMAPAELEAEEIEAGATIVVWSDSEDDADFVASRVLVQPTEVEEAEAEEAVADEEAEADEAEEAVVDEAVEETATEEAAATDA